MAFRYMPKTTLVHWTCWRKRQWADKHWVNAAPACVYVLYENKCLVGIYKGVIHVLTGDFYHNWPPHTQLEISVLSMKKIEPVLPTV